MCYFPPRRLPVINIQNLALVTTNSGDVITLVLERVFGRVYGEMVQRAERR